MYKYIIIYKIIKSEKMCVWTCKWLSILYSEHFRSQISPKPSVPQEVIDDKKKDMYPSVTAYRRNRNYRLPSLVLNSRPPSRRMPACRNSVGRVGHPSSMCTGVNFVVIKGRARVPCALA